MARKILVPVDDSERAMDAVEFAVDTYPDATLVALHVIDPGEFPVGGFESGVTIDFDQLRETHELRGKKLLETVRERAGDLGVDVETALETGRPSRTIVSYAEDNDVDLIVIGSHGRTGASRVLLGSVAEAVVRRSPVPVTVVR